MKPWEGAAERQLKKPVLLLTGSGNCSCTCRDGLLPSFHISYYHSYPPLESCSRVGRPLRTEWHRAGGVAAEPRTPSNPLYVSLWMMAGYKIYSWHFHHKPVTITILFTVFLSPTPLFLSSCLNPTFFLLFIFHFWFDTFKKSRVELNKSLGAPESNKSKIWKIINLPSVFLTTIIYGLIRKNKCKPYYVNDIYRGVVELIKSKP